jgi:polar amino acid transport system substrate-binding protein
MTTRWIQWVPLILSSVACGLPRDSDGTLDRVRGGSMRVGVVVDTPWTTDSAGGVGGIEAALVRSLASGLSARIDWVRGQEGQLLSSLEKRDIDLVIGGLNAASPWSRKVAFTRPFYVDTERVAGAARPEPIEHVMATAPGENAFLVRVEQTLIAHRAEVPRMLRGTTR